MFEWEQMMRKLIAGLTLWLCAAAANADNSTSCVQAYLSFLGYNVGPIDGLLGPRTGAAAEAYLNDSAAGLPALAKKSAAE